MEGQTDDRTDIPGNELAVHIVQAVDGMLEDPVCVTLLTRLTGFFRSIALRNVNALQDTLRLLTLWFKYGAHDDVSHAMATGFTNVEVDTWLEVIPQVSEVTYHRRNLVSNDSDHRPHPNAKCEYPSQHQQPARGRWKAPPASSHLRVDRRIQVK